MHCTYYHKSITTHDGDQGDEVVVMEEEDTSREMKRLWSTLSTVMKQIEVSIASTMSIFGVGEWGSL